MYLFHNYPLIPQRKYFLPSLSWNHFLTLRCCPPENVPSSPHQTSQPAFELMSLPFLSCQGIALHAPTLNHPFHLHACSHLSPTLKHLHNCYLSHLHLECSLFYWIIPTLYTHAMLSPGLKTPPTSTFAFAHSLISLLSFTANLLK